MADHRLITMAALWIHVFRHQRLERSEPLTRAETTVGTRAFCDLVLKGPGIEPIHGRLVPRTADEVEFRPADGGPAVSVTPRCPLQLSDFSLALEVRQEFSSTPRQLLDRVLELLPELWAKEDEKQIFRTLLDTLFVAFAAEWGAFFTLGEKGGEPSILYSRGERSIGVSDRISKTVIGQILADRRPVLVADVRTDPSLSQAHSIPVNVRSVIASPLLREDRIEGIVYLESAESRQFYSEDERDLLGRICNLAADHVARARSSRELARENERLGELHRTQVAGDQSLGQLVGTSPAMRALIAQIHQVAATDVTTLVLGESGTGKELVSKAIHHLSARRDAPFVAVNCMALPDELVESELFGHVKGAFSGATSDHLGRFEMAHRGTLFLDEIGELSLRVQVKLLRVLQERVIQRVGEAKERPVDVRLIAATNSNLEGQVSSGAFRDDLFFRLSVFPIRLPPLRERVEDLPVLIEHFIQMFNHALRRSVRGVDDRAMAVLTAHLWPGNVRELRNVIEAAFVRETKERLSPESLFLFSTRKPAASSTDTEWPEGLEEAKLAFEKRHILDALEKSGGRIQPTLQRLRISRSNLYKKLALFGIDPATVKH